MGKEARYRAFISYRHADNREEGRRWAEWLHQTLETYEVPRDLVGTANQREEKIPNTLYPIFRDEQELAADSDLSGSIRLALEQSETLIVLCSPRACESEYVAREIRTFKELGKADRILALIIDGEPSAADLRSAGESAGAAECLPAPLRFGVPKPEGGIDWSAPAEPLAADVRPHGQAEQGFTTPGAYRSHLEKRGLKSRELRQEVHAYEERLELARLKIIAGVLSVRLGTLLRRDAAYRARRFRRLALVFGALSMFALAAGGYAWWQRNVAESRRVQSEEARRAEAAANERNHEMLRRASQADYVAAQDHFQRGEWRFGIAYLGRSLEFDPENSASTFALWQQAVYGRGDRGPRLQRVFHHGAPLHAGAFSPDGKRFVTAGKDKAARLWDVETGKPIGEPMRHGAEVAAVAFSPDGTLLATGAEDGVVGIWDGTNAKSLKATRRPKDMRFVRQVSFNADGTRLLIVLNDLKLVTSDLGEATVWQVPDGKQLYKLSSERIYSAVFSPDGSRILSSDRTKTAQLWDAENGKPIGPPLVHEGFISSAAFSPDGRLAVTGSYDDTARIWDAATGEPKGAPLRHQGDVQRVVFSPDGTMVLTAAATNYLRGQTAATLWDVATGEQIRTPMSPGDNVSSAEFSPDGTRILTLSGTSSITASQVQLWDAQTATPLGLTLRPHGDKCVAYFSPDGGRLATFGWDGTAAVWDLKLGTPPGVILPNARYGGRVAFSPDGRQVITGCFDGKVRVWDASTGKVTGAPVAHPGTITSATYSPDGRYFASTSQDGTAMVWDAATRQRVGPLISLGEIVQEAIFSPDSRRLLTNSNDKIARLWEVGSGTLIGKMESETKSYFSSISFLPDGQSIVATSLFQLQFLKADLSQPLGKPQKSERAYGAGALSAGGQRVVRMAGNLAEIYELASGKQTGLVFPHTRGVTTVNYGPHDQWVLTGSDDTTAQLWDAETGLALGQPFPHGNSVRHASINPQGTRILTIGDDGAGHVWEIPTLPPPRPEELSTLVSVLTGLRFSKTLKLEPITLDERMDAAARVSAWDEAGSPWQQLGRWCMRTDDARTVAPGAEMTIAEAVNACLDFKPRTEWLLHELQVCDPVHPFLGLTAASLEKTDSPRARWLRERTIAASAGRAPLEIAAAEILLQQKQPELASRAAEHALDDDPSSLQALRFSAKAAEGEKDFLGASNIWSRLVAQPEATAEDWTNAIVAAFRAGHAYHGNELLEKALEQFPNDSLLRSKLGMTLATSGQVARGLELEEQAAVMAGPYLKRNGSQLLLLSIVRWLAGKKEEAIAAFHDLISANSSFAKPTVIGNEWPAPLRNEALKLQAETLDRYPEQKPKP